MRSTTIISVEVRKNKAFMLMERFSKTSEKNIEKLVHSVNLICEKKPQQSWVVVWSKHNFVLMFNEKSWSLHHHAWQWFCDPSQLHLSLNVLSSLLQDRADRAARYAKSQDEEKVARQALLQARQAEQEARKEELVRQRRWLDRWPISYSHIRDTFTNQAGTLMRCSI